MNRVVVYYQTFTSLAPIMDKDVVTHLHLAAVHFGTTEDGGSYIHLNDLPPSSPAFTQMWNEIAECKNRGIRIVLMVGGAGGGFAELFRNYETCFSLLVNVIVDHQLDGVDLDIEESVDIKNVKRLITDLRHNAPPGFIISMAPLLASMQQDRPGMGGFIYKDLFTSAEGRYIDYFTVQAYDSYTCRDYQQMIDNEYPTERLVMGMIYTQPFADGLIQIAEMVRMHGRIGGVAIWEYCLADNHRPVEWATKVAQIMNQ